MSGDPYFNNVILLLPMEGINNSTTFTDSSRYAKSIAVYGNTKISTAQSKWGNGSGYFDGSGDYLRTPSSDADFAFGSGDFTVESWVYITATGSSWLYSNVDLNSAGNDGFLVTARYEGSGLSGVIRFTDYSGGSVVGYNGTTEATLNTWHHIAFSRQSGVLRGFLDGALEVSATVSSTFNDYATPYIATIYGTSSYFKGGYPTTHRVLTSLINF